MAEKHKPGQIVTLGRRVWRIAKCPDGCMYPCNACEAKYPPRHCFAFWGESPAHTCGKMLGGNILKFVK